MAPRVHRHDTEDTASSPAAGDVRHKIVVMGAARVGKTSIITQFLYGQFSAKYKRTVEEMHKGEFCIGGVGLTLDILDTSGSFEVSGDARRTPIFNIDTSKWANFGRIKTLIIG